MVTIMMHVKTTIAYYIWKERNWRRYARCFQCHTTITITIEHTVNSQSSNMEATWWTTKLLTSKFFGWMHFPFAEMSQQVGYGQWWSFCPAEPQVWFIQLYAFSALSCWLFIFYLGGLLQSSGWVFLLLSSSQIVLLLSPFLASFWDNFLASVAVLVSLVSIRSFVFLLWFNFFYTAL